MATWYVKSGSSAAFQQSHLYTVTTDKMVPAEADAGTNVALARQWVWQCTTGGTSAGANPTWPGTVTQDVTTVTSNTAVFTARKPGFSSGTTPDWSFATCFLAYGLSAASTSDTVYVSNNHSENSASSNASVVTFASAGALIGPVHVVCANDSAAPPTASATTAVVQNTSAGAFSMTGNMDVYGVAFKCGSGQASSNCSINIASTSNSYQFYEQCLFSLLSSASGVNLVTGSASGPCLVIWKNCNVNFSAAGHTIHISDTISKFRWSGGSTTGTNVTNLFGSNGTRATDVELTGIDFHTAGFSSSGNILTVATSNVSVRCVVRGVVMPAAWSGSPITGTLSSLQTSRVEMYDWDVSAGTNNNRIWIKDYTGEITTEGTIVRSGGATGPDGVQMSWKFVSTANTTFPYVVLGSTEYMELCTWINDTSSHTYTVSYIFDNATGMTNAQMWMEAFEPSNATPLYSIGSTRASDVIATPTTNTSDSGSSWAGTGGMSNPNKQKMSLTFAAGIKGPLLIRVFLAKASTTVYVDPYIQVS
jgi:hypothetical protein